MKLRLSPGQLRLRLDEKELAQLKQHTELVDELPMLGQFRLHCCHKPNASLELSGNTLAVSSAALADLEASLPSRAGIRVQQAAQMLTLEVDVRDSVGQRGVQRGRR